MFCGVEEHRGGERKTKCLKILEVERKVYEGRIRGACRRDELLILPAYLSRSVLALFRARTPDRTASNLKSMKGPLSIPLESGTGRVNKNGFFSRAHDDGARGPNGSDCSIK